MMLDELNAIELLQNIRSYLLTLNPDIDEHLTAPEREHKLSHSPVFLKEKIVATLMRIDDITPARKRKVHTLLTSMESMLKEHHTVPKEFTINEKEELLYKGSSNRRVRQTLKALYEFASHTEGRTKNGLFPDIRTLRRSSPEIALHTITRLIPTLSGLDSFRYLRSIHYDIAVPDFAKCRFFYRLGMIESPPGSRGGREEYLRGCVLVARANRVSVSMVDRLIGLFTGVEKIRLIEALCVKEPQCERCVVTPYCSYFKYVEKPFKKNAPIPASEIGEERPRERLVRYGSDALTDAELLAIILRTGSRDVSVLELAKTALKKFHSLRTLDTASVAEIAQVKGIGRAKAAGVKAALQLGKRMFSEPLSGKKKITCSADIFNSYRSTFINIMQEVFYLITLDTKNRITREIVISKGSLSTSLIHPREVFKPAIQESAASVIFIHNHPSGDPTPSAEDTKITQRLKDVAHLIGIRVLDHIILGHNCYYSFADEKVI